MSNSIFDVAGPIMIGPSSSHTAGACKIGQIARAFFRGTPRRVDFHLYGSFATVYKGHATDRALLAGVMKMTTSDPRIKNAFIVAEEKNIKYKFFTHKAKAPEHHPNTVRIILKNNKKWLSIVGSSIGGGKVKITFINNIPIDLKQAFGRFFTILIGHENNKNILAPIYSMLKKWNIPIAKKQTISLEKRSLTALSIENKFLTLPQVLELEKNPGIDFIRSLTKLLKE